MPFSLLTYLTMDSR